MTKINYTPVLHQKSEKHGDMAIVGVQRTTFFAFAEQCHLFALKTGALFSFFEKGNALYLNIGNDNYRWEPERKLIHV